MPVTILGIESSCDDTAASIVRDGILLSNVIANQEVHRKYGGVVPELASRAHQQNIIPVVDQALKEAGVESDELSGVAFTRGPGLLGSLLVGTSFAKGFSFSLNIPLIEVNHLQAHIIVHFLKQKGAADRAPAFPFLCLLVSGGHTQLVVVRDHNSMEIIGKTIDDAAGEAFDKCAKVMGLPYPGGPMVDKFAADGNPDAYSFSKPRIGGLDYSFSGLKTSFLYFVRDRLKEDEDFLEKNRDDLCASIQRTIIDILVQKLELAYRQTGIREIALAGGVSANSGLRGKLKKMADQYDWNIYIPEIRLTTDNAAMIAITGYFKYLSGDFASMDVTPLARLPV
jgi:N6-L-threonylcarbamoyladenine synthase